MSAPKDNSEPVVQNVEEDDDVPQLESADAPQLTAAQQQAVAKMMGGKQTKRYAKAMQKLGLKSEDGIIQVMLRKNGGMGFSIARPEVYRFPNTNTFVMFGEVQMENQAMAQQQAAARTVTAAPEAKVEETKVEEEEEAVDAGDIPEKEIEIVMTQASVSRAKAVKALKEESGDVVNAIMSLTM